MVWIGTAWLQRYDNALELGERVQRFITEVASEAGVADAAVRE
jgi:hypothetical protein